MSVNDQSVFARGLRGSLEVNPKCRCCGGTHECTPTRGTSLEPPIRLTRTPILSPFHLCCAVLAVSSDTRKGSRLTVCPRIVPVPRHPDRAPGVTRPTRKLSWRTSTWTRRVFGETRQISRKVGGGSRMRNDLRLLPRRRPPGPVTEEGTQKSVLGRVESLTPPPGSGPAGSPPATPPS